MTPPAATLSEKLFIARWAATNFADCNETEVRETFIIELLHTLGYRKGTTYDLEMEKPLRLARPYHRIGRKKVAIDYAPSVRKRHFWIVEAKPGSPRAMSHDDLLQVHLYAVHPEVQARLVVLTNGWEVRVYDSTTLESFDDALLVVAQGDEAGFLELRAMLGARSMLKYQRSRLVEVLRETLTSEVEVEAVDALEGELHALTREYRERVRAAADDVWMDAWRQHFKAEETELRAASDAVLFVKMDEPFDGRRPAPQEYVRRVVEADSAERGRLVDALAMRYHGRPHNVFRVSALRVLVELLDAGVDVPKSHFVPSVPAAISELVERNTKYWADNTLANALCHLDNVAMRVAMKLCTRAETDFFDVLTTAWADAMTPRERAAAKPSPSVLAFATASHLQEILWRRHCSENTAEAVWLGIWNLQSIEQELDQQPFAPHLAEDDLIGARFVGLTFDHLRTGTWNVLRASKRAVEAGVSASAMAFAALSREDMLAGLPPERIAPPNWQSSQKVADLEGILSKAFALRLVATLGRQMNPRADEEKQGA